MKNKQVVKTKMRVLHLLYSGLGGHGNVFENFVLADKEREFGYGAIYYGIEPVRNVYKKFCHKHGIRCSYVKKRFRIDLFFYLKALLRIWVMKPNVLFLHGSSMILPALVYGLFTKVQIIVRETQANHLKTHIDKFFLRVSIRFATDLVFLTEEYKSQISKDYSLPKNKVSLIPNGINLDKYLVNRDYKKSVQTISMVSRLVPIKDHLTLVSSMKLIENEFPDVKLLIAGAGVSFSVIQNKIQTLNLKNVELLGAISEEEIIELLKKSDVYVHPTFGETMSTSLMQAMGSGLPIISSDVNGVNNMITKGQNGLLCPTEKVDELYLLLKRIIKDANLRETLGVSALKTAQIKFSSDQMFKAYRELIVKH